MTVEEMQQHIDNFFNTHSQKDILTSMYEEPIKRMRGFNRSLWEEAIDNQIELNDENCWYSEVPNINKFKDLWLCLSPHIGDKIPWQECDNASFPTSFFIVEHNGKQMVVTLMVGQGSSMDLTTVDGFKSWMDRIGCTYTMPEPITLDELEYAIRITADELEKEINEADTTCKAPKFQPSPITGMPHPMSNYQK